MPQMTVEQVFLAPPRGEIHDFDVFVDEYLSDNNDDVQEDRDAIWEGILGSQESDDPVSPSEYFANLWSEYIQNLREDLWCSNWMGGADDCLEIGSTAVRAVAELKKQNIAAIQEAVKAKRKNADLRYKLDLRKEHLAKRDAKIALQNQTISDQQATIYDLQRELEWEREQHKYDKCTTCMTYLNQDW